VSWPSFVFLSLSLSLSLSVSLPLFCRVDDYFGTITLRHGLSDGATIPRQTLRGGNGDLESFRGYPRRDNARTIFIGSDVAKRDAKQREREREMEKNGKIIGGRKGGQAGVESLDLVRASWRDRSSGRASFRYSACVYRSLGDAGRSLEERPMPPRRTRASIRLLSRSRVTACRGDARSRIIDVACKARRETGCFVYFRLGLERHELTRSKWIPRKFRITRRNVG